MKALKVSFLIFIMSSVFLALSPVYIKHEMSLQTQTDMQVVANH
ncbi:hypothetical protein [Marinifaba aquimaris]|nr:hypothetical protein [Marinifaba aquimaris]